MRTPRRRSFVIIAVLIITGSALFIATGAVFIAQAEVAGAKGVGDAAHSRSLAWSGLKVVIGELDQQRETILRGEVPRLDEQYEIYDADGRAGIVRLLPVTPDGRRLAPEAGKLDVNRINAEALAATGMIDDSLAQSIIAFRDSLGRPLHSIDELLDVPDVTAETLYGPLSDVRVMEDALADEGDLGERTLRRLGGTQARGLVDVLTVFAVEPPLQRNGRLRINLNIEWSDDLGRRLDDRFGEGAGDVVKGIIDDGTTFDSDRKVVEVLRFFESPHEDWPDILDALTTDGDEFHFGRVDINTALEPALLGLPGITPEIAAQIVRAREGLDSEHRSTIVWPLLAGILESQAYEELVDKVTVRSWTYRVRIAAGEVESDEPRGPLSRPVVWEAVIDLASPRPRIAYLRDITLLQTTARIASNLPDTDDDELSNDFAPDDEAEAPMDDVAAWDWRDELDDLETEPESDPEDADGANEAGSGSDRIGRWKIG